MKNLLYLAESEKNRILGLHKKAIIKESRLLSEQVKNQEDGVYNNDKDYDYKKEGDKYFFKYSTPSDYIDAIAAKNLTWKVKRDDGFPYSSAGDDYWTGYFTSRPNAKSYIRRASANLYASS